ncbi:FAD-binding oxidoreductase [Acetobacter sp. TBRC 12305]|uniref:FAD-binding oxidoreductase n=1 Tax=Acetobacter garciniae TaxID=2817435 RepID=A0A939KQR7_9PROT|nr:FAD-binding oxidoreductase [Acetobacter garciniae]MBO1324026.1 FAD-binding oxidoreductase [Acetobacter garciniae]MBX0343715.1 FAD-binding oxidoreductase [Acetobacter garciniae]
MTRARTRLDYTSWGRVVRVPHEVVIPGFLDELPACVHAGQKTPLLAVGMRRSYGDSVINNGNLLIDMTGLDRLMAFDDTTGVLRCEAGATIDEILQVTVPRGWFLPTTPGTRFVTLGGAVANDVHGKNHHRVGSMGCSVRSLTLLRTDTGPQRLYPGDPLFHATIGGLGLTGVIADVELALTPIGSAFLDVERIPYGNIGEFFSIARESTDGFEHTVSWIDCANGGHALGRGIFQRANWCHDGVLEPHRGKGGLAMPFDLPARTLNSTTIRLFNTLYNRLQQCGPHIQRTHYAPFFYPLDSIRNWNRMYGATGLYQYQCVIPMASARHVVEDLVRVIAASGAGSFLAVLKTFGSLSAGGYLSFPMEGATLALDFANRGAETLHLMARLDQIVAEAGGRLYAAKDGRMPAPMFQSGYPDWTRMQELKDPATSSDFWRRVSY